MRQGTRRFGYELVPFSAGIGHVRTRALGRCGLAIDVGANVGQYGQRLRAEGYAGPILSFEPSSDAFAILNSVSARQGPWEARRKALGAINGTAWLNVSENSVSSSLLHVQDEHVRAAPSARVTSREEVDVATLDSEIGSDKRRPFWLKLDVQGHEKLRSPRYLAGHFGHPDRSVLHRPLRRSGILAGAVRPSFFLGFRARYVEPGFEDPTTGYMQQADIVFLRD